MPVPAAAPPPGRLCRQRRERGCAGRRRPGGAARPPASPPPSLPPRRAPAPVSPREESETDSSRAATAAAATRDERWQRSYRQEEVLSWGCSSLKPPALLSTARARSAQLWSCHNFFPRHHLGPARPGRAGAALLSAAPRAGCSEPPGSRVAGPGRGWSEGRRRPGPSAAGPWGTGGGPGSGPAPREGARLMQLARGTRGWPPSEPCAMLRWGHKTEAPTLMIAILKVYPAPYAVPLV